MIEISYYVAPGLPEHTLNRILKPVTELEEDKANRIINLVVQEFGLSYHELISKCRKRCFTMPRQIAMALIKINTKLSLKSIGKLLGGRHHTTVLYAIDTVKDICDTNKYFKSTYIKIQSKI